MRDEPAIGADVEALQGGAAVGVDVAEGGDYGGIRERAGGASSDLGATGIRQSTPDPIGNLIRGPGNLEQRLRIRPRAGDGDRPRQLGLRGCVGNAMDYLGQAAALRLALDWLQHLADVFDEGRGCLSAAVLVAVAIGEEEPAPRQRQADVKQVALLGVAVVAGLQAERLALALGAE